MQCNGMGYTCHLVSNYILEIDFTNVKDLGVVRSILTVLSYQVDFEKHQKHELTSEILNFNSGEGSRWHFHALCIIMLFRVRHIQRSLASSSLILGRIIYVKYWANF